MMTAIQSFYELANRDDALLVDCKTVYWMCGFSFYKINCMQEVSKADPFQTTWSFRTYRPVFKLDLLTEKRTGCTTCEGKLLNIFQNVQIHLSILYTYSHSIYFKACPILYKSQREPISFFNVLRICIFNLVHTI